MALSLSNPASVEETVRILQPDTVSAGEQLISGAVGMLFDDSLDESLSVGIARKSEFVLLEAVFPEMVELTQLKLFYTGAEQNFASMGFEYCVDGRWHSILELNRFDGRSLSAGWNRFRLQLIQTDRVRVRIDAPEGLQVETGLSALEFWGEGGALVAPRVAIFSDDGSELLFHGGQPKDKGDTQAKTALIVIDQPLTGVRKAELRYEAYDLEAYTEGFCRINGGTAQFLTPDGTKDAWSSRTEEINPALLVRGENRVEFSLGDWKKNGFTIRNVQLILHYDDGNVPYTVSASDNTAANFCGEYLSDGNLLTLWETGWGLEGPAQVTLTLSSNTAVDEIRWYQQMEYLDSLQIQYEMAGQWWLLAQLGENQLTAGWNTLKLEQNLQAEKIRFVVDNPYGKKLMGRISEMQVLGSRNVLNPRPEIVLVYPEVQSVIDGNQQIPMRGFVRNGCTMLTVNGEMVPTDAYGYFAVTQMLRKEGAAEDFRRTIRVEAQDAEGRVSALVRQIYVAHLPQVEIAAPVDGTWIQVDEIEVSGSADTNGYTFYLNDLLVDAEGRAFSVIQPLEQGANLLTVRAVDNKGLEGQDAVTVYCDSQAPVVHFAAPYHQMMRSGVVAQNLEGFVEDYTVARLWINGEPVELQHEHFSYATTLQEGYNYFTIQTEDEMGNCDTYQIWMLLDNTLPDPFTPEADPSGWTNNSQPVLSFATTDMPSGIARYEYKVVHGDAAVTTGAEAPTEEELVTPKGEGPGGRYVGCVSPLTLPAQPDGVHTVWIKAVDNVGLVCYGAPVQIYIDTTPPEAPVVSKLKSGDREARIECEANMEWDLAGYRLYREPAWSDGAYVELALAGTQYRDRSELENGQEYAYWLTAVDHVGNESTASARSTVEMGVVEEVIDPALGGVIEYADVTLEIPAGAFTGQKLVKVSAVDNPEILPASKWPRISPVKSFNLIDVATGAKVAEPQFDLPVTVTFHYDEELIPEGYLEQQIRIFYYDARNGGWVMVPNEVINPFDNTVTVNLDHFSIYQVSVVDNYTTDIASYKNLGLAPYLQYFKNHQEYVSPGSGSLNIQAVDLYLPGRNGLDISIVRAYSSARAVLRTLTAHEGRNRYPGFGNGWTLNLPLVELTQHGEVVYLEEGSGFYLDWEEKTTVEDGQLYETIYKEGLFFQARKKVIKTADVHFNGETIEEIWENAWLEICLKDGKSYYFDENGAIVRIADRTEANTITFAYHDDRIVIEDTLGRNVVINYNRDHLVTSIASDVYEVTYQYYTGQEGQPRNALAKVTQQGQWETVYHYEQDNVRDGSVFTYDIPGEAEPVVVESITDNPVWVIASVQYPSGGSSHYTYENRWRRADATITGIAGIYEGRLVTDVTCQYREII